MGKESCKIVKCTCKHSYQDETYGEGMRVFNPTAPDSAGSVKYRCTVCSSEKGFGISKKEEKEGKKK